MELLTVHSFDFDGVERRYQQKISASEISYMSLLYLIFKHFMNVIIVKFLSLALGAALVAETR